MAKTRPLPPSSDFRPSLLKKAKADQSSDFDDSGFAHEVFDPSNIHNLHATYASNEPFKYAVLERLFQDELLQKVKDECLNELRFEQKETDIYKVRLTPCPCPKE